MTDLNDVAKVVDNDEDHIACIVMHPAMLPAFEEWLDQRGHYLSVPIRISGEPDPEGELNRFVWPKRLPSDASA